MSWSPAHQGGDAPYRPTSYDQPWLDREWQEPDRYRSPDVDRLTHLVLVDGRLVDVWSEPVEGSRWEHHARRFDDERRPALPPQPVTPDHELALQWLDAAVGGRSVLLALDADRTPDDIGFEPDGDLPARRRELVADTLDLLDAAAVELGGGETRTLLVRALALICQEDSETLRHLDHPTRLAAGVAWVIGRANGLFGPTGRTTQAATGHRIGHSGPLSTPGREVHLALAGFRVRPRRPSGQLPDLLMVGRVELLSSTTRRRLIQLRDQALAAAAADGRVTA